MRQAQEKTQWASGCTGPWQGSRITSISSKITTHPRSWFNHPIQVRWCLDHSEVQQEIEKMTSNFFQIPMMFLKHGIVCQAALVYLRGSYWSRLPRKHQVNSTSASVLLFSHYSVWPRHINHETKMHTIPHLDHVCCFFFHTRVTLLLSLSLSGLIQIIVFHPGTHKISDAY